MKWKCRKCGTRLNKNWTCPRCTGFVKPCEDEDPDRTIVRTARSGIVIWNEATGEWEKA